MARSIVAYSSKEMLPDAIEFLKNEYGIIISEHDIRLVMNYNKKHTKYFFPYYLTHSNELEASAFILEIMRRLERKK